MSPRSTAGSPEPGGIRKRRRTPLACDECRDRKRKCDGVKPVCGACRRRSITTCVWNEERVSKMWTNSYVEGLRARIRELESSQNHPSSQSAQSVLFPGLSPPEPANASPEMEMPQPMAQLTSPSADQTTKSLPPYYTDVQVEYRPAVNNNLPDSPKDLPHSLRSKPSPIYQDPDPDLDAGSDSDDTDVNAMGVIAPLNSISGRRNRRPSEYFGPSSTASLVDRARNAMGQQCRKHWSVLNNRPCSQCQHELVSALSPSCASTGRSHSLKTDSAVFGMTVPPRDEADDLVENYWRWTHSLYPSIHRPSFEERYRMIWYPQTGPRCLSTEAQPFAPAGLYASMGDRLFYCMLNSVFALGALFSPWLGHKDRDQLSRGFFERAKKLMDLDMLAAGSLALVQTLLLMSQYLQSTEMSSTCWNIVGLAVRVAQNIGLHHDPKNCNQGCCPTQALDQAETEMRRRAWAGCVLLDRVLCLTYGRPLIVHAAMSQSHLVLPVAVDDEYLTRLPDAPGSQPDETPSLTECYVQTVQLQDILGEILTTLYHSDPNPSPGSSLSTGAKSVDFHKLFAVDSLLTAWHKRLPPHLQASQYKNSGEPPTLNLSDRKVVYRRQAIVLEVRYLHVRLMMLRPVLSGLCDPASQSSELGTGSMQDEMVLKAANLCVSGARELLQLIEDNIYFKTDVLSPPWYTVFYIHSCAMVFLISLLCSPKHIHCMDEASLLEGLSRCFAALKHYQSRSRAAGRCRKFLISVQQEVFHYRSQNGVMNDLGVLETPGTAVMLGGENSHVRPDPSIWNKDLLSRSDIMQEDVETPIDDFMVHQINIQTSIDLLEELAGQIMHTTDAIVQPSKQSNDMLAMVFREPLGVQVGIAPWNASLFLGMRAVATPIACGNTAILKASEKTPMAHHFIGRLFHDAGFPAGVLNVIQHSQEDAVSIVNALVSDSRVRKINFTGSTAVGKIIAANAAKHCKPVLLELGGKSAQLVLPDADLDKAAQAAAIGAFTHHGQVCMSTERILVSESVLDKFSEKLAVASMRSSENICPGASVEHTLKVTSLLEDAQAKGARILGGGEGAHQDGSFLTPRILANVTREMKIWHTETFAPIALLIPFSTVDEAVALANDTAYGLSASVYTANIPLAIEIGRRLDSGSVHINSMTIHDEAHMPHGGVKESGWGRFGVPWGFAEFTQLKTITITDTHLAG
ncbi:aldehyde dehydrogenase family-domain-containing protein [Trichoderma sp. SZMC 28011]